LALVKDYRWSKGSKGSKSEQPYLHTTISLSHISARVRTEVGQEILEPEVENIVLKE
jgi:hypothetical protein